MNNEFFVNEPDLDMSAVRNGEFESAVRRGVRRAARARRLHGPARALAGIAAAVAVFALGLNSSPAFAMAVGHVPGLRELAQLVTFDKGLKMALENEYFQPVGQAAEHNGVTVNIGGVMADDGGLTLFWDASGKLDGVDMMPELSVKDMTGKELLGAGASTSDRTEDGVRRLQFSVMTPPLPDTVTVELKFRRQTGEGGPRQIGDAPADLNGELFGTYTFTIDIDRSIRKPGVEYPIGKALRLTPGAAITVDRLVVYPTHARLFYEPDSGNTEEIRYLSLHLVNERGESFNAVTGVNGMMESTFFSSAKRLTLIIDKASTLPKNELWADIDPATGAVSGAAADWLIPVSAVKSGGALRLSYTVPDQYVLDRDEFYAPFTGNIRDDAGNPVTSLGTECRSDDNESAVYTLLVREVGISGRLHVELGISPPVAVQGAEIEIK